MPEQPGAGRLDPETLAAYIDGLLPPEERARVDAEIAADPETYEWVVNSIGAVDDPAVATPAVPARKHVPIPEPPPAPVSGPSPNDGSGDQRKVLPFYRRRSVQGLLGTLLAAAAALVMVVRTQPVWWQEVWGPSVDPRFAKLVEAVGEARYIEARLTGGFKYGPLRQVMRGPGDLSNQNLQLLAAAGELQKAAEMNPSAENLHAWGVAQLLLGQPSGAVETLRASLSRGASLQAEADLAASLMARATILGAPEDLPAALNILARLIQRAGSGTTVRFNYAATLEALGLTEQASRAWEDYLAVEPRGPWADEARDRLERLSSVDKPPYLGGSQRGASPKGVGERLATLADTCHETSIGIDARTISVNANSAPTKPIIAVQPVAGRAFCASLRQLADGVEALEADDLGMAARLIAGSKHGLAAARSPLTPWADYHLALLAFHQRRFSVARQALGELLSTNFRRDELAVKAHAAWTLAVVHAADGEYQRALELLGAAEAYAGDAREFVVLGRVINQTADLQEQLGKTRLAWSNRLRALRIANDVDDARLSYSVLGSVSAVLRQRQLADAASLALAWQAETDLAARSPISNFNLLARRVDAALSAGLADHARQLVAQLQPSAEALSRDPRRDSVFARLGRAKALLALVDKEPAHAADLAAQALSQLGAGRDGLRTDLLLAKAAGLARAGAVAQAIGAVDEAATVVSRRLGSVDSAFDAPDLYLLKDAIDLVISSGVVDNQTSLRLSELDHRLRSFHPNRSHTRRQEFDEVDVHVRVMAEQTIVWVRSLQGLTSVSLPLTLREASALTHCFQDHRTLDLLTRCGSNAYEMLFRPIEARWAHARVINFTLSSPLDRLPVASLFDKSTEQYLVERHQLVLVVDGHGQRDINGHRYGIATIVVPSHSEGFGWLPPLPSALGEGRDIASVYPTATLLSGTEATPERVVEAAAGSEVVHFGTHAVLDPQDGRRSRLILSPGAREDSITGSTVAQQSWGGVSVVVLAACAAGLGDDRPSSPLSLAAHVLAAGAKAVVAPVWPIQDEESRVFFVAIHQGLAAGLSAELALQQAQIARIASARNRSDRFGLDTDWMGVAVYR